MSDRRSRILVTGAAGFIGSRVAQDLAAAGHEVLALDCFTDNYPPDLKRARVAEFLDSERISFVDLDAADREQLLDVVLPWHPEAVVHLAARPGVREGIETLHKYVSSNLVAFANVVEAATRGAANSLLYASSSSVYGDSVQTPSAESEQGLRPISYYGATKLANELLADALARGSSVRFVGMRLFTVYGPWGRPDMLPWRLVEAALEGRALRLFGTGEALRDFTFIDDAADCICALSDYAGGLEAGTHRVVNVGGGHQRSVLEAIGAAEHAVGRPVAIERLPAKAADVAATLADTTALREAIGRVPETSLDEGMVRLAEWCASPSIHPRLASWSTSG